MARSKLSESEKAEIEKIAENLRNIMKTKNVTQTQLVDLTGIARSTISDYYNGRTEIRIGNLEKIAIALGVRKSDIDGTLHHVLKPKLFKKHNKYPVYGRISAGGLNAADQYIESFEYAETDDDADYFFLKVEGDCMSGSRIKNGDLVLIRKQEYAEDGQIVAALIDGEDATLKRYKKSDGHIILSPDNPEYEIRFISEEQLKKDPGYLRILGVLKQLVVKF